RHTNSLPTPRSSDLARHQNDKGENEELDHDRRPETYLTGGSILGGNAGSVLSGNQQSEEIEAEPEELLKRACELGLEGIIAKRRSEEHTSERQSREN